MLEVSFEKVDEILRYEQETGKFYWKVRRGGSARVGCEAGNLDSTSGYIRISLEDRLYQAHRVAHLLVTGHWPEGNPEHENRIRHDNRWDNIKTLARNQSENMGNIGLSSHNTSGLKGVCWDTQRKKWLAYIKEHGKVIMIGRFSEYRLAGLMYDAAAKIKWGLRFSHLNFPPDESDYIVLPERVLQRLGV